MTLLEELNAHSGSYDIAIIAATISILIGGILFGVGLGFSIRRLRMLGAEEVGQGILSAAMVGALFAFTVLINTTVPSLVPPVPSGICPITQQSENPSAMPYSYYMCNLEALQNSFGSLSQSLARSSDIAGFASSIKLDVGVVAAQPFFALQSASQDLHSASQQAAWMSALAFFEFSLADIVRSSALVLFLPAGLILRTFFATRKLGAAAMALSISAFVIYPLLFLHTFTVSTAMPAANNATAASSKFNSDYASIPTMPLDDTSSVKNAIDSMSQHKFADQVQSLFPQSFQAISLVASDLVVFPLASLIISLVCALELYRLLSAPIFLPYFEAI